MQRILHSFTHTCLTNTSPLLAILIAALGLFLAPSLIPVAQAQSSTLYTQFTAQNLDASTTMNARMR